jgi:hypothetical protein
VLRRHPATPVAHEHLQVLAGPSRESGRSTRWCVCWIGRSGERLCRLRLPAPTWNAPSSSFFITSACDALLRCRVSTARSSRWRSVERDGVGKDGREGGRGWSVEAAERRAVFVWRLSWLEGGGRRSVAPLLSASHSTPAQHTRSTTSQHTLTAHPQHTLTAHPHSTPAQHTLTWFPRWASLTRSLKRVTSAM